MTTPKPPEPSTAAAELAEKHRNKFAVGSIFTRDHMKDSYLAGYAASENDMTPLDERCFRAGVKEGRRLTAEIVERKDRELSKQYQEILTLKAEHDRLQEDLCEKVVSEGGKLEATLAALQKQNEGMREALEEISKLGKVEFFLGQRIWPKKGITFGPKIAREALAAADESEGTNG